MDAPVFKTCFKCGEAKLLQAFHKHSRMADGHLNKCGVCVVKDVAEWRKKNPSGRKNEYARSIENGRNPVPKYPRFVDGVRVGKRRDRRLLAASKHQHKRSARVSGALDELTELAFSEAYDLCTTRTNITGFKWTLDHIVPLHHRLASGLHVAANFQVVPDRWNYRKSNKNMNRYFGL